MGGKSEKIQRLKTQKRQAEMVRIFFLMLLKSRNQQAKTMPSMEKHDIIGHKGWIENV